MKTQDLIGKILPSNINPNDFKDAIHVSVMAVTPEQNQQLQAGDPVRLVNIGCETLNNHAVIFDDDKPHGIIDPFLYGFVNPGDFCFMFLLPNSTTGLRHVWSHPEIDSLKKVEMDLPQKTSEEIEWENECRNCY